MHSSTVSAIGKSSVDNCESELESHVNAAFEVWMDARSQSISQNFAQNALECLNKIRSTIELDLPQRTRIGGSSKVYIGAITDGNSDPLSIPELSPLFDFVIRAEDVGVSKPDKRVYKAAVAALIAQLQKDGRSVEEFFLGGSFEEDVDYGDRLYGSVSMVSSAQNLTLNWMDIDTDTVDAFSESVGPWWVHVGDDFFKDVVASKEFRMRSVWVRELIGDDSFHRNKKAEEKNSERKQRSVHDLVNEISEKNGVIEMSIGDSEFLMNSLHEEFSDAILNRFDDLCDLLIEWHEEGKRGRGIGDLSVPRSDESTIDAGENLVVIPRVNELDKSRASSQLSRSTLQKKKFCVFCGDQIPLVAKFCSGCGQRQI